MNKTRVKVANPMEVPAHSTWDDDRGRTSGMLKKRMQSQFFKGSANITGEIIYVASPTERDNLRRKGLIKIRIRDAAGTMLKITADPRSLHACH